MTRTYDKEQIMKRKNEKGQALVFILLLFAVLLFLVGLASDGGRRICLSLPGSSRRRRDDCSGGQAQFTGTHRGSKRSVRFGEDERCH